jgi:hypothetical protein
MSLVRLPNGVWIDPVVARVEKGEGGVFHAVFRAQLDPTWGTSRIQFTTQEDAQKLVDEVCEAASGLNWSDKYASPRKT